MFKTIRISGMYYAQFPLQKLAALLIYFRRLTYIITNDIQMTMLSAKIKKEKLKRYKNPVSLLIFLTSNASKSIRLFSFSCYSFVETSLKMKLNTLVAQYRHFLTFIFVHTISPNWRIMPL